MGVELVHDQCHVFGGAVSPVEQVADEPGSVAAAALERSRDILPVCQRLARHEQACDPVAGVDVVIPLDRTVTRCLARGGARA